MDKALEASLQSLIYSYASDRTNADAYLSTLLGSISDTKDFLKRVEVLDEATASFQEFNSIREYIFDILLVDFYKRASETHGERYLESPEWENIEEQTLDRGSELLNVILYIDECEEEEEEPTLDGFLNDFLSLEDDLFQEDCEIYEPFIKYQELVEASYQSIEESARIVRNTPLGDLYYPVMAFFSDVNPDDVDKKDAENFALKNSPEKALYLFLCDYYKLTLNAGK